MTATEARSLENIAHELRQMNKALTALNENMAAVGKLFKTWLETDDEGVDKNQMTLEEANLDFNGGRHDPNARTIQFHVKWTDGNQEQTDQVAEGLLRKRPDDTYQIELLTPGKEESQIWPLPPGGPWKFNLHFQGRFYDFNIPSFESAIRNVYGSLSE